ncbi:hypothetical protein KW795_00385 [Candidatus Microgenomates bacterium]|nr:hypothetical protein [Candidatus Microgenomates bacterium]
MKINKLIKLLPLLLLVPIALLVFKNLFLHDLSWGDAPFFYSEAIKQLVSEPLAWTQRGINFGGVNLLLWISPVMLVYGFLGKFINFSNDTVLITLFFVPSILMSIFGSIILFNHLRLSKIAIFFATLVYAINTYFILLVDGGQVGVCLAYGIFPITLFFLKKFSEDRAHNNFFISLLFLFITSIFDPRIAIICLLTIFTWISLQTLVDKKFSSYPKFLLSIILLIISWILLSSYWIYPLIKNNASSLSSDVSNLHLTSILHPLFLFSPHWYGNLFGKVSQPFWYFCLIPVLIFTGPIFTKKKEPYMYALLFLFFAFLTKGNTYPLGNWYDTLVNLPFGFAFRDSSKFFTPSLVFAGILIGQTISSICLKLKNNKIFYFGLIAITFTYLMLLVWPVFTNNMNFNLSIKNHSSDFDQINMVLSNDDTDTFRSIWFPEKYPTAFETNQNPTLDAYTLINSSPFAHLNASEDWFNFLYNPKFVDWFRVLGIKYLILSNDPRNITKNDSEQKNWDAINTLVSDNPNLKKINTGTSVPVFKLEDIRPRFYSIPRLYAVVGGPLDTTLPAIYFEDGKWDPRLLEGKDPDSVKIYFGGLDKVDLTLSFLQKYFVSTTKNTSSQWSVFANNQYLKSKYELLIRGVSYKDFDYSQGIAFSTQKDEEINFDLNVADPGEYLLLVRMMTNKDSQGLENLDTGLIYDTGLVKRDKFVWVSEEIKMDQKGKYKLTLKNRGGLTVINVVALVPKQEFDKAQNLEEVFVKHFGTINTQQLQAQTDQINKQQMDEYGTLKYQFVPNEKNFWLILNENYNPLWQIRAGSDWFKPAPIFSMENAFYIDKGWNNLVLEYKGQDNFRWGMYLTAISGITLVIVFLWRNIKKD